MKYKYASSKFSQRWINPLMLAALFAVPNLVSAQQGSWGSTKVFNDANATLFGAHTFSAGTGSPANGLIITERTAPFGTVSFGPTATYSGATDASHVDGYVRKYGTAAFSFPIGNGGKLRPVAISAPATNTDYTAAYWFQNPGTATLPAGAPFAVGPTSYGTNVLGVSNVEYWDVDGTQPINLTLTWDAASSLGTLPAAALTNVVVVGFNATTNKWDNLGRAGGTTGTLATTGSVTANGVTPNNYSAFTFGIANIGIPDLTPAQIFSNTQLNVGDAIDYVIAITNVGAFPTSAPFQFNFTNYLATSGLVISQISAPSVEVDGDVYTLSNGEFDITTASTRLTLTSKTSPNVTLNPLESKYVGFRITRTGGSAGQANNTVTIVNGTGGGEAPTNNNTIANQIIKN